MERSIRHNMIAGLYGNALEWYDFLLYASFAPIFSDQFFPSENHFASLLATFGVFAIGFVMRPVGGFLFGHYGDNVGRRKALILSIVIMTFSTLAIALLPTYEHVGVMAPLFLTLLRLIQGLAVGGELPGSATYLIEHMFHGRRGFAGSLVLSTAFFGIFCGSFVSASLSATLSPDVMTTYGWRYAYLFGGLLGLFGIYLRVTSTESPEFSKNKQRTELPAKEIVSKHRYSLFLSVIFTSIMAIANYVLIAFVTTFLVKYEGFPLSDALLINFTALLILTLCIPLMGWLSDIVGRKRLFIISLILLLLFTYPIFWLLAADQFATAFVAEIILSLILAPINATVPTMIAEMFPTNLRASGISIGYNIGQMAFGGTVPIVALTMIEMTNSYLAPATYVITFTVIVLLFATRWQEPIN